MGIGCEQDVFCSTTRANALSDAMQSAALFEIDLSAYPAEVQFQNFTCGNLNYCSGVSTNAKVTDAVQPILQVKLTKDQQTLIADICTVRLRCS